VVIPAKQSPKSKNKNKASIHTQGGGAGLSEASGAINEVIDNTACFFISPQSDVKEEVLRYYDINKEIPKMT